MTAAEASTVGTDASAARGRPEFGIVLPTFPDGADRLSVEAAARCAAELGWSSIWTTDHVLIDRENAHTYGHILEPLTTLAYLAALDLPLRLGTSAIVVPLRNAVVLAKELATLDQLSGGRLVVGVGAGWNETEFASLGLVDRFRVRGRYLDEAIRLWRHLWSGAQGPFEGEFHRLVDFAFSPLPIHAERLPIIVGGNSRAAASRAGRLGDGYQTSRLGPTEYAVRVPNVRLAAAEAGRQTPRFSARVPVVAEPRDDGSYALSGSSDHMIAEVRAFIDVGVSELVLVFESEAPERVSSAMVEFHRDVIEPLVAAGS